MKKLFFFTFCAFLFTLFLSSCSVQKRYHRKGFTVNWNQIGFSVKNNKKSKTSESELSIKDQKMENEFLSEKFKRNISNSKVSEKYNVTEPKDVASIENSVSSQEIYGTVEETRVLKNQKSKIIKPKEKTKKGFFHNVISKRVKKSIAKIKTASAELKKPVKEGETKLHWSALTGFIVSLVGLFISPILLGITAIVFSAIGLSAIKRNPDLYKGKGFAIAGLVVGIIDVVLIFLLLVLLLALV